MPITVLYIITWHAGYREQPWLAWLKHSFGYQYIICFFFLFVLFFVTPEGFITVVANEGLEKARAYLNQVPRDRRLYIPSKGCGVNFRWKHLQTTPTHFFGAELSRLLGEKIPVAIVGLEPGTPGSVVQHYLQ